MEYIIGIVIVALIVLLVMQFRKPSVTSKTEVVDAHNIFEKLPNTENQMEKIYSISSTQSLHVFKNNDWVETLKDIGTFSIKEYFETNETFETDDTSRYQFFILNHSMLKRIPLSYKKPVEIKDAYYDMLLEFMPVGSVEYTITDMEGFMNEFGFFKNVYSTGDLKSAMRKYVNAFINSVIVNYLKTNKFSLIRLNYHLDELEEEINAASLKTLKRTGCEIKHVMISEIKINDTDTLRKLNKMLMDENRYKLQKYSYVDEKKKEYLEAHRLKASVEKNKAIKKYSRNDDEDIETPVTNETSTVQ